MAIRLCLCCLIIALMPLRALAVDAPVLTLTGENDHYWLNSYLEVLTDPSGKLTSADVLANPSAFQPLVTNPQHWEPGFTRSAYWFRLTLRNHSREADWYFIHWGSLNRSVRLYLKPLLDNAGLVELEPLPHARIFQFRIPLPPGSTRILYCRIQDQQAPLAIAPELLSASGLVSWTKYYYPFISFIFGGLLTLTLYNFLYFLHLRDRSFLTLAVLTSTFALEIGNHLGLWQAFAWMRNNLVATGTVAGFVCIASGVSLIRQWLGMDVSLPKLDKWWRGIFWISLGLAASAPLLSYTVAILGVWAVGLMLLGSISLLLCYRRNLRLPWSMILAGMVFLLSLIPALLRAMELISEDVWVAEWPITGLTLALMLLSFSQAQQMRQKHQQAERTAAANQAKDDFLATMSHELRTPMTAVVNAGQLLTLTTLSARQQEYVSRLNTSSRHMLALINDILDLARLDSQLLCVESQPFQLDIVLAQTEQLVTGQARDKQLKLVFSNRFHPLEKQLTGDPVRLRQILLNLLNNAIKFTPQGEVRLTVTPRAIAADSATLLFEIRDTGIGMSAEQQQKLFQPFSQADSSTARQYGGSGLGLAISHQLVGRMGGELQVESMPARGSRFFFSLTFPLQASAIPPAADSAPARQSGWSGLRILLVDDDEANRFFGARLLEALGMAVTLADSGGQAWQCLQEQAFDLVLMDVSMPGMDGYATTRNIRANPRYRSLPIVALTAHAIAGERERCLAAGMNDYLTKPLRQEALIVMLQDNLPAKVADSYQKTGME